MPAPVHISYTELLNCNSNFLVSLESKCPETRGTYQRALREFLRWFPRDSGFLFRKGDVERYKNYLADERKLSAASISTYLTALRRFCGHLVAEGIIVENPAERVSGNTHSVVQPRESLSRAEILVLLATVERQGLRGLRDYAILLLMIDCGLSEIEIIRADKGDLVCLDGQSVLFVQGKGRRRKDAAVVLPHNVKDSLDMYLARRGVDVPNEAPLFMSDGNRTRGMRMTTRGIRDRVNHYLECAYIRQGRQRKITPYSLRHTAALMMADEGATVEEIRRRMRLSSNTTAMLYIQQHSTTTRLQKTY